MGISSLKLHREARPKEAAPEPEAHFTGLGKPDGVPTFSLCHSTARVDSGWVNAAEKWLTKADNPSKLEYILCADAGKKVSGLVSPVKMVWNYGRRCAVDGWNASAEPSVGKVIITVADDWFPCDHWDTELLSVIPSLDGEWVVELNTGGNDGLLTFNVMTRKYYNRFGYLFYPEYWGMYADNEFTDVARRDGVVINARHLPMFQHFHPEYGTAKWDDTYRYQHRSQAFEIGEKIYMARKAANFPPLKKKGK